MFVSRNGHVRGGLAPAGLWWELTTGEEANWFPVTRLSQLIDAELFGIESGPHHLVNVALHTLTTLLLFAFLYRVTRDRWPGAFVAALFAMHPLHVESVAWITERKDMLFVDKRSYRREPVSWFCLHGKGFCVGFVFRQGCRSEFSTFPSPTTGSLFYR